jgi:WD40 repeat protein
VTALDFSRDGSLMISASGDETVLQWDMSLESWGRRACVLANRSFTPDEWTRFLPDAPYHATCEE